MIQNLLQRTKKCGSGRLLCMAVAVCSLFGLSVYLSYSLGQYRTMYDNPIYRWRASIAVALSELRDPPLRGYVAYRSISDYLNQNGLALMEGEASPLPSYQSVRELVYDPDRLEKLFQDASIIPIDYRLAPVPIVGNEKGEADFYYWAFRLFGIHLTSLWYFYFLLLAISVTAFSIEFWRSPTSMLVLFIYLVGHLYMVDFASTDNLQTVHNSRFLPVLSILPSVHLTCLILRGVRPRAKGVLLALVQTMLLFFVIFNRLEAAWQAIAIIAAALLTVPFRTPLFAAGRPASVRQALGSMSIAAWPAVLVLAGGLGLIAYQHLALDRTAYRIESRTHTFWDPLLVGTISASPELIKLYGMGQPPYSDNMGYYIAEKYIIDHHEITSPIAVLQNGTVVGTFAMHNMGAFDEIQRRAFFQISREHPWLVLRSFVYDKSRAELKMLWNDSTLYRPKIFLDCILLAFFAGVVIWSFSSAPVLGRPQIRAAILTIVVAALLSLSTVFIYPTTHIPDMILLFLLLILAVPACAPLLIKGMLRQRLLLFGGGGQRLS
jgi:hypothetical protein